MARNGSVTRRSWLKIAGAASATALIAGCTGGDDDGGDDAPADDDGDDGEDVDESAWEDVDEIVLEAITAGWEGISPDHIAGEQNPTLVLFEGEEYTFRWENGDGAAHNIEIWDENEDVVGDYQTDIEDVDEQTLEGVVASSEMAYYRCSPHQGMQGPIDVR